MTDFSTKSQTIEISEKLIESDNNAWQIKNITGISQGEYEIPFKEPEPEFNIPHPSGELKLFRSCVIFFIGFLIANAAEVPLIALIAIVMAVSTVWDGKKEEKEIWHRRYNEYKQKHDAWKNKKNNPDRIYSLSIETNAGSKPVFYSFDKPSILKAVGSIKKAMIEPLEQAITYNIETVELSSDTNINNIGSNILNQNIQEVR